MIALLLLLFCCGHASAAARMDDSWGSLEFGRKAGGGHANDLEDSEVIFRELLLETDLYMSMSMSLSMSMDYSSSTTAPTTSPVDGTSAPVAQTEPPSETAPPTMSSEFEVPASNDSITCNADLPSATTVIELEVDTAVGVTEADYTDSIAVALADALGSTYTFCLSAGRLRRKLEDAFVLLGDPEVQGNDNASCSPSEGSDADACSVATVSITAYGEGAPGSSADITQEVESILFDDEVFDAQLLAAGVVDVRMYEGPSENASNSNGAETSPTTRSSGKRPKALVAILSVTGTILAGIAARRLFAKRATGGPPPPKADTTDSDSETMLNTVTETTV